MVQLIIQLPAYVPGQTSEDGPVPTGETQMKLLAFTWPSSSCCDHQMEDLTLPFKYILKIEKMLIKF